MKMPEAKRPADLEEWQTGGGCTAWGKTFDGGGHLLVTVDAGPEAPSHRDEPCCVGLYNADCDDWITFSGFTTGQFLDLWESPEGDALFDKMAGLVRFLSDGSGLAETDLDDQIERLLGANPEFTVRC